MSESVSSKIPCGLQTFRRNAYFNGKLLTRDNFELEQKYLAGKDRLHNAYLHGTGTVCGLEVTAHPNEECRRTFVVIEPGLALDCCGNEIVVAERTVIDINAVIDDAGLREEFDDSIDQDLFLSICYVECGDENVPVILPDCDCASNDTAPNLVRESWKVTGHLERSGVLAPVVAPAVARLDWVQTLVLQDQAVTAVAFDEELGQVYVGVQAEAGGARMLVYDASTHDLITAVETGSEVTDIAISPRGHLVYVAGTGVEGSDGVAVYQETDLRGDDPTAPVIDLAEPLRLVVADDGTLFLHLMDSGELVAWREISIQSWLDDGAPAGGPDDRHRFELGHAVGADAPARRGANTMRVSADGRTLYVLDPDADDADRRLRMISVSAMFSGDANGEPGDEVTVPVDLSGDPVALSVSFDGQYVFVLGQNGDESRLDRFRVSQEGGVFAVVAEGRGGAWPAAALDLSLAPGEKWAYALENDADGRSSIVALLMDEVAGIDSTEPVNPIGTREAIAGTGRFQRLAIGANRIYAASNDAAEVQPDRGLVAVIDVAEADCGSIFDAIIDGCPTCADVGSADHCLVIAHLPAYTPDMLIQDAGQGSEDDVHIDNLTFRRLVPSSNTIVEVVRCMLEAGVVAGRPGPRGPAGLSGLNGQDGVDGVDGVDGADGTDGTDGADGADGADGSDGADGADGGDGLTDDLAHITNISWFHDRVSFDDLASFLGFMDEVGLVIAFDRPIFYPTVRGNEDMAPSGEVLKLFGRMRDNDVFVDGMPIDAFVEPCTVVSTDGDGRIDGVTALPQDTEFTEAVRLRLGDAGSRGLVVNEVTFLRVLFRSDLVIDENEQAVDGNHIFPYVPLRPTGNRIQGGSFESWFATSPQL